MTIVLFLIDTSASMAQKTYLGTSLLDMAKQAVETFLKQRMRDQNARFDRYMLMTFEDYPKCIKAGWREGQSVFQEQLKGLKARGLSVFGSALGEALRFVNLNRFQNELDNYSKGLLPFCQEQVLIVAVTDANSFTSPAGTVLNDVKVPKATATGNELIEEPFRWDQRIFSLVLRLPGHPPKTRFAPGSHLPVDSSPIDTMCAATGGRSFCVSTHRMLPYCIEWLVQKVNQQGIMVKLEKAGPDPAPLAADSAAQINGDIQTDTDVSDPIESEPNKRLVLENGLVVGKEKTEREQPQAWHFQCAMLYAKAFSRAYSGHWPIPENFWPDSVASTLPSRKAHPVLTFRCESSEPIICHDFPFDKYELEPCALTQYMLDRKQKDVCWQVFVLNSGRFDGLGYPFGYLKVSSTMNAVNLFIMPYNYPVLLPLLEEAKNDKKLSTSWKVRFNKYLKTVPHYYYLPLKKALHKLGLGGQIGPEMDQQQYAYSIVTYLMKVKMKAVEDFTESCRAVERHLKEQQNPFVQMPQELRVHQRNPVSLLSSNQPQIQALLQHANADLVNTLRAQVNQFHGFRVFLSESSSRPGPSIMFRNAFEVPRSKLLEQLPKMRTNLEQQLKDTKIPVLEGGLPGQRLKIQHAEDLHNQPISSMGNYQEYVKGNELVGKGPLREVEPKAIRQHAFGNPFKLDKKNMLVDEVGEGMMLGGGTATKAKRPTSAIEAQQMHSGDTSKTSRSLGPPKRKPGPLPKQFRQEWRARRKKRRLMSLVAENVETDDICSIASDDNSAEIDFDNVLKPSTSSEPILTNGNEPLLAKLGAELTASWTKRESPLGQSDGGQDIEQRMQKDATKIVGAGMKRKEVPALSVAERNAKFEQIAQIIRKPGLTSASKLKTVISVLHKLSTGDKKLCVKFAKEQSQRLKQRETESKLKTLMQRLKPKR